MRNTNRCFVSSLAILPTHPYYHGMGISVVDRGVAIAIALCIVVLWCPVKCTAASSRTHSMSPSQSEDVTPSRTMTLSPSREHTSSDSVSSSASIYITATQTVSQTPTFSKAVTLTLTTTESSDTTLSGSPTDDTQTIRMSISNETPTPSTTATLTSTEYETVSRSGSDTRSVSSVQSNSNTMTFTVHNDKFSRSPSDTESEDSTATLTDTLSFELATYTLSRNTPSRTDVETVTKTVSAGTKTLSEVRTASASPSQQSSKTVTITPPPTPSGTPTASAPWSKTFSTSSEESRSTSLSPSKSRGTHDLTLSARPTPTAATATITTTLTVTNTTTPPPTPSPSHSISAADTMTLTGSISQEAGSKSETQSSDGTLSSTNTFTDVITATTTDTYGTMTLSTTHPEATSTTTWSMTDTIQQFPNGGADAITITSHTLRLSGVSWNISLSVYDADIRTAVQADIARSINVNTTQVEILGLVAGSLIVYYRVSRRADQFISAERVNLYVGTATYTNTSQFYLQVLGFTDAIVPLNTSTNARMEVPPLACGNTCVIAVVASVTPVLCIVIGWFLVVRMRGWCRRRNLEYQRARKLQRYRRRHGGSEPPSWYSMEPFALEDEEEGATPPSTVKNNEDEPPSFNSADDDDEGYGDARSTNGDDIAGVGGATPHDAPELDDDDVFSGRRREDDGDGFGSLRNLSLPGAAPPPPQWLLAPLQVPWYRPTAARSTSAEIPPDVVKPERPHGETSSLTNGDDDGQGAHDRVTPLTDDALAVFDRQQTPPRSPGVTPRQHRKNVERDRRMRLMLAAPSSDPVAGTTADDDRVGFDVGGGTSEEEDDDEYEYEFVPLDEASLLLQRGEVEAVLEDVEVPPYRSVRVAQQPPPTSTGSQQQQQPQRPAASQSPPPTQPPHSGVPAIVPKLRLPQPPPTDGSSPPPIRPSSSSQVLPATTASPLNSPLHVNEYAAHRSWDRRGVDTNAAVRSLTPEVLPRTAVNFNFAEWEQSIEFPEEPVAAATAPDSSPTNHSARRERRREQARAIAQQLSEMDADPARRRESVEAEGVVVTISPAQEQSARMAQVNAAVSGAGGDEEVFSMRVADDDAGPSGGGDATPVKGKRLSMVKRLSNLFSSLTAGDVAPTPKQQDRQTSMRRVGQPSTLDVSHLGVASSTPPASPRPPLVRTPPPSPAPPPPPMMPMTSPTLGSSGAAPDDSPLSLPGLFSPPLTSAASPHVRRSSAERRGSSASSGNGSDSGKGAAVKSSKRRRRRQRPPVDEDDLFAIVTVDRGVDDERHQQPSDTVSSPPPTTGSARGTGAARPAVSFRTPGDERAEAKGGA